MVFKILEMMKIIILNFLFKYTLIFFINNYYVYFYDVFDEVKD